MAIANEIVNWCSVNWPIILGVAVICLVLFSIIWLYRRMKRYNHQARCGYCGILLHEEHCRIGHTLLCSLCTRKSLLVHKGLYYFLIPFTISLGVLSIVLVFHEGVEWNLVFTVFSMVVALFQLRKSIQQHSPKTSKKSSLSLLFQRVSSSGLRWLSKTWPVILVFAVGGGYVFRNHLLATWYRSRCDTAYRQKAYDKAITSCTKAIQLAPTALHYRQRAKVYTHLHYDRAIADYSRAIELAPENIKLYLERAKLYMEMSSRLNPHGFMDMVTPYEHQYDLAIADYSHVLHMMPSGEVFGQRGVAYFRVHDYDNTMKDFQRALEIDPNIVWVYEYRGTIHANHHQYEAAIADYTKYLQGDNCQCTNQADVYVYRGVLHALQGHNSQAQKDFLYALHHNDAFLEKYYVWGYWTYTGEYDFALDALTTALEQEPENAMLYLSKAFICEQVGHLSEAFLAYQGFLTYDRTSQRTFIELANTRMKSVTPQMAHPSGYHSSSQEAIQHYTKALTFDDMNPRTYLYRGYTYLQNNEYDLAIRDLTKTVQLAPEWDIAYEWRAEAYGQAQQYEHALQDYTTVLEHNPTSSSAYWGRGDIYRLQRSYNEAIADYTRSLELKQQDDRYIGLEWNYLWRGHLYAAIHNYDAALADYDRTSAQNPDNMEAYICRGDIYADMGDESRAAIEYTNAVNHLPKYRALDHIKRGIAYDRLGDYQQARHEFLQSVNDTHYQTTAQIWLGQISLAQGEYTRAFAEFTSAMDNSNNSPSISLWQGLTHTIQGQSSQALSVYRAAVEHSPNFTVSSELSFRLCTSRYKHARSIHTTLTMLEGLPSDQPAVLLGKAMLYEKTERISEAIEAYTLFIQKASSRYLLLVKFAQQSVTNLQRRTG